jgi:precorrin-2 dehydrogenase / sirohydrochlorin ferrochelatase
MFPVALNLKHIPIVLVGQGELLLRRLAYLDEDNAAHVRVFSPQASAELKEKAGNRLLERLPTQAEVSSASIVLAAALERAQAEEIAGWARAAGKLVNVEDVNDLCDFYFTANVRRGDLVIAVSTSGASPTLARKVRDAIAARFGAEWAGYVRELSELRLSLKARGASMKEVIDATEGHLAEKGWLTDKAPVKDEAA